MRSRRLAKSQFLSVVDEADAVVNSNNAQLIERTLTIVNESFDNLRQLYDDVDDTPENERHISELISIEQKCKNTKITLINALSKANQSVPSPSSSQMDTNALLAQQAELLERMLQLQTHRSEETQPASVKLPQLGVPRFSGHQHEWTTFHDFFRTTIHENDAIADIQKFQYLKSAVSGDAQAIISAIPISSHNYNIAWNTLLDRFNKPFIVIRSIIQNFSQCNQVSANLSNFSSVINHIQTAIDMLDARGDYARSRDPWIIHLIIEKLDRETKKLWSRASVAKDEPKINDLLNFLNERRSAIELDNFQTGGSETQTPVRDKKPVLRAHATSTIACIFCNKDHLIHRCSEFLNKPLAAKEKFISDSSRCYNCFGRGHSIQSCKSRHNCSKCHQRHHTLLHPSERTHTSITPAKSTLEHAHSGSQNPTLDALRVNSTVPSTSNSILPTAVVHLIDSFGNRHPVRALLDSGSQAAFISDSLVKTLGLSRKQTRVPISRLGDDKQIHTRGSVDLNVFSRLNNDDYYNLTAYILPKIIEKCPSVDVIITYFDAINREFPLADPTFHKSNDIELILGSSFFFDILGTERYLCQTDSLFLQNTRLGYVACSKEQSLTAPLMSNFACVSPAADLNQLLERFWSIEEPPTPSLLLSAPDQECENSFIKTTYRLPTGRFCVRLPFSTPNPTFINSLTTALNRFRSLERRFSHNEDFRQSYCAFMAEYESLGHMTRSTISMSDLNSITHFVIPHHGIYQHGQKLRVVFDASARDSHEHSLNDALHSGPVLQLPICDVITRFRLGKYALTCDIAKMYRQILIDREDRNYQLIVWRDNSNRPLCLYQLNTVTYGQKCSPFLALRVLNELIARDGEQFTLASEILTKNRYVDDVLLSNNSLSQIITARDEIIALLGKGCFELRKWATNEASLLKPFPEDHIVSELRFTDTNDVTTKTLGICWIPSDDVFTYRFHPETISSYTKRQLISESAKLYDPLGWLSPVTVKFKILIQEAWTLKTDWDSVLPDHLVNNWVKLRSDLCHLQSIRIPRHLGTHVIELHGFADASKSAYAAVVYTRSISSTGEITVRLIMSKTKLAPIKTISIPRLELCAAHLLAKIIPMCISQLDLIRPRTILWTDSKVVLAWIHSLPRRWTTFVANRVSHIQELCSDASWRHVKSSLNPADLPSRGINPQQLIDNYLWWKGPEFLSSHDLSPTDLNLFDTTTEEAVKLSCVTTVLDDFWPDITRRFSNFNRLIRTVAYVIRAKDIWKKRIQRSTDSLTASETKQSLWFIIRKLQEFYYHAEVNALRHGRSPKATSTLQRLRPFLDHENVLRSQTRLTAVINDTINSTPIILPASHFAEILIRKTHLDLLHAGPTTMMATLRQTYWIAGSMRIVKRVYRSCQKCTRHNGVTFSPHMGPLPECRQKDHKPFLITGLDFAGPITIKPVHGRSKVLSKAYISVFICLSTKAMHLELVHSLSVTSLLMALRRFLARRGRCDVIWSDNGTNFVGCSNLMSHFAKNLNENLRHDDFQNFLSTRFIEWRFIPPYSPHFGGIWEAGVRRVKHHLTRCFDAHILTVEELQTALAQIEEVLNSRPLTPISLTDSDVPLTPSHLLTGSSSSMLPTDLIANDSSLIKRRQLSLATAVNDFWSHWRNEYLSSLITTPKWRTHGKQPKIGDLVLIKRPTSLPKCWETGRIAALLPGPDKTVRVVKVLTTRGEKVEAARNLVLLNVSDDPSTGGVCSDENET